MKHIENYFYLRNQRNQLVRNATNVCEKYYHGIEQFKQMLNIYLTTKKRPSIISVSRRCRRDVGIYTQSHI